MENYPRKAASASGDLIEVSVYNVPELNTKARVGNSGDLYLPLIDYVHVEGLTLEEAQKLIQKRLQDGGFFRNPHVTIFVDEASSQGVTISRRSGQAWNLPRHGGNASCMRSFPRPAGSVSPPRARSPSSAASRRFMWICLVIWVTT